MRTPLASHGLKARSLIALLMAIALTACASTVTRPKLLYGLGDDALNQLGERFGYRVEALGMSDYSFTRGRCVFQVLALNDISVSRRIQADQPVVLRYYPPGHRAVIESEFSIEQGIPYSDVEQHFADFIRRVERSGR
jgi:hypothetical protein